MVLLLCYKSTFQVPNIHSNVRAVGQIFFFFPRSASVRFRCFYVLMSHVHTPVSKSASKWLPEWCFWSLSMQVHHYTRKDKWLKYKMTFLCAKRLLPDVEYAWNHLFSRGTANNTTQVYNICLQLLHNCAACFLWSYNDYRFKKQIKKMSDNCIL